MILAVGTRFPETDSSSWEEGVTFQHSTNPPHPCRSRPPRAGSQLPRLHRGHRRRRPRPARHLRRVRRPDAGARVRLGSPPGRTRRVPRPQPRERDLGRVPAPARANPCRRSAGHPRRDPGDRRGLEQERRRAAVPGGYPRLVPHPWWLLHDGVRPGGRPGRGIGFHPARRGAGRRWRLRLEPERRGDRRGDGRPAHLGGHEQLGVRHHRRTAEEALRDRLRLRVRG